MVDPETEPVTVPEILTGQFQGDITLSFNLMKCRGNAGDFVPAQSQAGVPKGESWEHVPVIR